MKFTTAFALISACIAYGTAQTEEEKTEPVQGSLLFFNTECPSEIPSEGQDFEIESLDVGEPVNKTDVKSMYWVYPSTFYQVEFYKTQGEEPYAIVQGTKEGVAGHICNGFNAKHQVEVYATEEAKQHDGLFLGPDSYFKVIRIRK